MVVLFICLSFNSSAQNSPKYYSWTNHPQQIVVLDSLIQHASSFGLERTDYKASVLINTDLSKADSIIHNIALHFFGDMAYGNRIPDLAYEGVKFTIEKSTLDSLIKLFATKNALNQLVENLNNQSKEVQSILYKLNQLKDSLPGALYKYTLLKKAANEYRWLHAIRKNNKIILVNIPSTLLHIYDGAKNPINRRVIVGKIKTPTSTLSSVVEQIIINPYWVVPRTIATKEILPILQRDRSYLERNNFQVLNEQFKIIDVTSIHWQDYSLDYFPFTLRQSTGCDNSLGVLKLNFDSPFGIYLHDTPEKSLFEKTNRFFSHGCMRMEKPVEIGKWVLQKNSLAIDSIDFTKCYKNPQPQYIKVVDKIFVLVWYSLIDFDLKGQLQFYKDIYQKFPY